MRRLGLVELQRAGDRAEHLVGDAAEVAALQPGVVVDAHAGDHRHLLAPQSRHPPMAAVGGEVRLLGGDLRPASAEEVADLRTMVHVPTVRRARPGKGGPASTRMRSVRARARASRRSATSASASAGPHVPGVYEWIGDGWSTSGCMTRHAASMVSCRPNRGRPPLRAASRRTSYGVGPSPPSAANSMSSDDEARLRGVHSLRVEQDPHARRRVELASRADPAGSSASRSPKPRFGGGLKTSRTSVWVAGRSLPVRMKNGTPDQRQFSTSSRRAQNVSVVESAATPSTLRYPSN